MFGEYDQAFRCRFVCSFENEIVTRSYFGKNKYFATDDHRIEFGAQSLGAERVEYRYGGIGVNSSGKSIARGE